jgi:hypothetical protein
MAVRLRIPVTALLAVCSLAAASAASGASEEKVLVCHGTASATNEYVLVEVSANALNGHLDLADDGTVVGKGHGAKNYPDEVSSIADPTFVNPVCQALADEQYGGGGGEE